jgi:hypothetical protein
MAEEKMLELTMNMRKEAVFKLVDDAQVGCQKLNKGVILSSLTSLIKCNVLSVVLLASSKTEKDVRRVKIYNSRNSLMVTYLTTDLPVLCSNRAE